MSANQLPRDFGNYVLQSLIARGGMAEIYRAKMRTGIDGFEKPVAIKKILPNLAENEEFITMLIDEARISVSLNHANIAQVYDLGRVSDSYYIAMEYVPGVDLAGIIKKLGKDGYLLPLDHAIFITKELCAGLYFAHRKTDDNGNLLGIVHRDISPHNILVSFSGDVKIIDFGVAKASVKLGQTRMGVIKGKLLYMAPEQAMAKPIDARADIFSAGLCLYRMLTGRLPFEAENEFQIYNKVLTAPIAPPRELNPEIPDELNNIVMKALARDLEERYADGWLMHQDLEIALQRVSPGYTSKRLAEFLNEYFADERPEPIATGRGRSSSYPSTPSASSSPAHQPAGHGMAPNTPPHWQQPAGRPQQQVTVDQNNGFVSSGPTVPISGAEIASIAQQFQNGQMGGVQPPNDPPPLPSPEQLGWSTSSENVLGEEDFEGDPTIDMQLDPNMMQKVGDLMRANGHNVPEQVPIPAAGNTASAKKNAKNAKSGGGGKTALLIGIGVMLLLLVLAVVAFLAFGGLSMLGIGDEPAAPVAPVDKPAEEDKPKEPVKAEPKTPADPTAAFKEATATTDKAFGKAGRKFRADVFVNLTSEPPGAEVSMGRKALGQTPLTVEVPRGDEPVGFTFKLKGYQKHTSEIVPSTDRKSSVTLQPRGAKQPTKPNKGGGKKGAGGTKEKKDDNGLMDVW